MEIGFWKEFNELKEEIPGAEWGYLENEPKRCHRTPYVFLHGECNYFAQYLHDTYGYKLEGMYEEPNQLVHAYCKEEINGKTYYIDIRGITDNWDKFIEEFYDSGCWCGDYDYTYYLTGNDVNSTEKAEDMKYEDPYKASKEIDAEYGYYNIKKILKGEK